MLSVREDSGDDELYISLNHGSYRENGRIFSSVKYVHLKRVADGKAEVSIVRSRKSHSGMDMGPSAQMIHRTPMGQSQSSMQSLVDEDHQFHHALVHVLPNMSLGILLERAMSASTT